MSVEIIKFGAVPGAVAEGNEEAILELIERVTAQAKVLAPVDSGELRGSIMGKVKGAEYGHQKGPKLKGAVREGEGYVGSNVEHAPYNEFGTRKLAAQPFLRPAVAVETGGGRASRLVKRFQIDAMRKGMKKGPRKKKVI